MGTLQVGGTTLGVKNTVTNKVDLSNVGDVTLTSSANIKAAINASGSAPIYACRAWVNFEGDGTPTIRDSGNVSSIGDLSSNGEYQVNYTTNVPSDNVVVASAGHWGANVEIQSSPATGSVQLHCKDIANSASHRDADTLCVAVFA